ncbi:MAG: methyltransferase domain-containing protein [Terriglobia bacterium]
MEIFGVPLALPDFPVVKSVRGFGMSDDLPCASVLASKLDYRNTFYHDCPRFDIQEAGEADHGGYDFIISGDVFEHVEGPPETAFRNAFALLKPHGFLAMSVPYSPEETTQEHFPDLYEYGLVKAGSRVALVNRKRNGEWQVFDKLVFHGGQGSTLEMRVFGEADLRSQLAQSGFTSVDFAVEDYPPFGIVHQESWSLPAIARRGSYRYQQARETVAEIAAQYWDRTECFRRADAERVRLENLCRELHGHLESVNADLGIKGRWAMSLQEEVERNTKEIARIRNEEAQLRAELESRTASGRATEAELRTWALGLEDQLRNANVELTRLQAEFEERTQWALRLRKELDERTEQTNRLSLECDSLKRRLGAWEASRWSHLGRALGLGPKFPIEPE